MIPHLTNLAKDAKLLVRKLSKILTIEDQHEEDWEYTNNILCFPMDIPAAKNASNEQPTQATPTPSAEKTPSLKDTQRNNFIVHPLNKLDTLMGLSLRYNVQVTKFCVIYSKFIQIDELKRVNQLTSHNISHLDEILIPLKPNQSPEVKKIELTEKQQQDQLIRTFKSKTGVELEEAKYYLDQANYDLTKALNEYKADAQWESTKKKQSVL